MSETKIRILNENDEEVIEPDLTTGYLVFSKIIKKDATPIDNTTKFAWADEDYEDIYRYVQPSDRERAENRIAELKLKLYNTDYIVIKIAEGVCTEDDYPGIKEHRQQWRDEINDLENSLKQGGI